MTGSRPFCALVILLSVSRLTFLDAKRHPYINFFQETSQQPNVEDFVPLVQSIIIAREALLESPKLFLQAFSVDEKTSWNTNVSQSCVDDVGTVIQHARNGDMWALQFADAAGKPESGILQGNFAWLGSFGECEAIKAVMNNETEFRGKYCLASIGPHLNATADAPPANPEGPSFTLALRIGVCFPDRCSDADTFQIMKNVLIMASEKANITGLDVYGSACQPRTVEYDTKAIIALSVVGAFVFFLAIGTLYDIVLYQPKLAEFQSYEIVRTKETTTSYPAIGSEAASSNGHGRNGSIQSADSHHAEEDDAPLLGGHRDTVVKECTQEVTHVAKPEIGILGEILMLFSLYTNTKRLLTTTQSDQSLSCIHGIRFFSMTWVVLAHSYVFVIYVIRDIANLPAVLSGLWFQAIVNATVSVDTFFAMSGLLVSYLFVLNYQKTKTIPIFSYYIHRYWRLTAAYGIVMVIYLYLFKYINHGPQWQPGGMEVDGCTSTWWTNLLYVNNIVRTDKQCMGWTWYLANDMQFYWISPVILVPLIKFPKIGLGILAVFFIAHIITTAVLSAHYNFPPGLLGDGFSVNATSGTAIFDYFDKYYSKPWTRIGPYLVGMFFGYLLVQFRGSKLKIPKYIVLILWAAATAMALSVVYGLYGSNNGHPLSPAASAIYNTLHRSVWALSVCWVIFACVHGYGGFVNTILSWPVLVPLSRVTYCCYLIHIPILLSFYMGKSSDIDFSHFEIVYYFFGTLMTTYGIAILFTLGCETPLLGLEKLVSKSLIKSSKRSD